MTKDPTQKKEFRRILGNLLKAPPKPHSEMKLGENTTKKLKASGRKRAASAKPKSA